jgi:hypothetical protein
MPYWIAVPMTTYTRSANSPAGWRGPGLQWRSRPRPLPQE